MTDFDGLKAGILPDPVIGDIPILAVRLTLGLTAGQTDVAKQVIVQQGKPLAALFQGPADKKAAEKGGEREAPFGPAGKDVQ